MREYSKGIIMSVLESNANAKEYIVWSPKFPLKELHLLQSIPDDGTEFNPGDFVSFKLIDPINQRRSSRAELIHTCTPANLEIIGGGSPTAEFQVQVQIAIPSRNSTFFDILLSVTLDYGIIFYCYSPQFGKIASFVPLEELKASYGKFYIARIERVSKNLDWLIEKIGTFFNLADGFKLVEIVDPVEIQRLSPKLPWNRSSELLLVQTSQRHMLAGELINNDSNVRQNLALQVPNNEIPAEAMSNAILVMQNGNNHDIHSSTSTKKVIGKECHRSNAINRKLNDFWDYENTTIDYSPLRNNAAAETTINQAGTVQDKLSEIFSKQQGSSAGLKEKPLMKEDSNLQLFELATTVKNALSKLMDINVTEALDMQRACFTMCNKIRCDLSTNYVGAFDERVGK